MADASTKRKRMTDEESKPTKERRKEAEEEAKVPKKKNGKSIVSVFYAPEEPNEEGELNFHRFESCSLNKEGVIQQLVGGSIEMLPHKDGYDGKYVGFADEEGLLKGKRRNDLAGGSLGKLGFLTHHLPLGYAYAGTVVVVGNGKEKERGLNAKERKEIEDAISEYRKAWNEEDGSEDSSESEKEKKIKKKKTTTTTTTKKSTATATKEEDEDDEEDSSEPEKEKKPKKKKSTTTKAKVMKEEDEEEDM